MMILRVPEARIEHLRENDPRKLLALLDHPASLLLELMMQMIEVEPTPEDGDYDAMDKLDEREDDITKVLEVMYAYLTGTAP
jgi:hypothetical protein